MENLVQSDICGKNNSQFQMAIADFFHCENFQYISVESHWFLTMIAKSRLAGNDLNSQTGNNLEVNC